MMYDGENVSTRAARILQSLPECYMPDPTPPPPTASRTPGPQPAPVDQTMVRSSDPSGEATPPPEGPRPRRLGRYELGQEIGRGGMGSVVAGRDPSLGREVAVKILLGQHRGDSDFVRRFVEEAKVAGGLQHPGVVPIHDHGTAPDGRPFFVMKRVQGRTLSELLRARPDPDHEQPRFLKIFEQVCQTIAYAHSQGVIHRDLKPSNVMVGEFGEVQVMDWGLAKVLTRDGRPVPDADAPPAPDLGIADDPTRSKDEDKTWVAD